MSTVYLNGEFLPRSEARVSVDDRGFLFADSVYEVSAAYRGEFFRIERHLARLARSLRELRIDFDTATLIPIHRRLLVENGLSDASAAYVYVQVTRGVAPRTHAFPTEPVAPTVYAYATRFDRPGAERWGEGFEAVTVPDRRWARVDVKTTALLPNCMAQQTAAEAGVQDAILVKDGIALEGAHNNFWAVIDGIVVTHPVTNVILPGIMREYVLELCSELGLSLELRPIFIEELAGAEEAFMTGTTTEVRPLVRIDGRPVGDGRVGPVTRRLYEAFLDGVGA
jgi:D-alanine transaminase